MDYHLKGVPATPVLCEGMLSHHSCQVNPLNYIRPSEEGGRVRVVPPKGITVAGCKEWEKTLVGYFIGPRLHYPLVSAIAHKLWDAVGLEEVLSSENGFFFFLFSSDLSTLLK